MSQACKRADDRITLNLLGTFTALYSCHGSGHRLQQIRHRDAHDNDLSNIRSERGYGPFCSCAKKNKINKS